MGVFGSIGSLIGGNEATDEMADQLRVAEGKAKDIYGEQKGRIDPFYAAGRDALTSYSDLLQSPGEVDPVSQAILDRSVTDAYNTMRARGLGDSGAGWRTLLDTAYRGRQDARARRIAELLGGVGLGTGAIGQYGQAGRDLMSVMFPARKGIGEAKAAGTANMWTQLGSLGDQAAAAIAGAAAGGAGGMPGGGMGAGAGFGPQGFVPAGAAPAGGGNFDFGKFATMLFA